MPSSPSPNAASSPGTTRSVRRLTRLALVAAALALVLAAAACGDDDDATGPATPVTELTFLAGFRAQANLPFVGAYVAQEQGFFAAEGLAVTIEHSEGGGGNLQLVAQNRVQITTADAAIVLQRRADAALPIVAVALIGQQGQQGWVSLAGSGIDTPADWAGKRVGYRNTVPPDLLAILDANGVDPDSVNLTDIGFQPPQLLLEGIVDVYPVFLSNEPDTIRRTLGREVNVFSAADDGVPALGLTYVTSEDYLAGHADAVERFLRATLRGIEWAQDHPEEAVGIVLTFAPQQEREHQRFMLATELAAARVGAAVEEGGIGWFTPEQWQALYDTLVRYGALAGELDDLAAAYDRGPLEAARGR